MSCLYILLEAVLLEKYVTTWQVDMMEISAQLLSGYHCCLTARRFKSRGFIYKCIVCTKQGLKVAYASHAKFVIYY